MSRTNNAEFNLIHEPWILAADFLGNTRELNLLDVFKYAHELRGLSGELPTQDVATMRLLLSIMYAVYQREDCDGNSAELNDSEEALERWASLWQKGVFDTEQIGRYLGQYKERFFLFHQERPFYQVNFSNGTEYGSPKLIGELSESSNKPRLFQMRTGSEKANISYPEAARWLIYLNSFDDTSAKPSIRGQGLPSAGAGWLGKLGLIFAFGSNLFETLMMNFVLLDDNDNLFPIGKACWELDSVENRERLEISIPKSPLELLTVQSRRLLLLRKGEEVIGYRLLGGDLFPKENATIEQMTVWRYDEKSNELKPRRHDPSRVLWRDYSSLVSSKRAEGNEKEPGIVRWVSLLEESGKLTPFKNPEKYGGSSSKTVTFRTASVKYTDKDFTVEDVFEDGLVVNAQLLTRIGDKWNVRIGEVIGKTDKCIWSLGKFAVEIINSGGNDRNDETKARGVSASVREKAYFILDIPFRQWLQSIKPESDDLEETVKRWLEQMSSAVIEVGEKYLIDSGDRALVGRSMGDNALYYFGRFRNTIYKIIRGD